MTTFCFGVGRFKAVFVFSLINVGEWCVCVLSANIGVRGLGVLSENCTMFPEIY